MQLSTPTSCPVKDRRWDVRQFPGAAWILPGVTPEKLGSAIGAVFGLIFVLMNTGSLPTGPAVLLRVLGVLAFVGVLVAARRPGASTAVTSAGSGFTRGYWVVVAGEVLAIAAGLAALHGPLQAPQAAVAWISLVVGAHFIALAFVWRQRLFHGLGGAMALCGALGLFLAVTGASNAVIDVIGGVTPGAVLLGFGLWGSRTSRTSTLRPLA
jgi:hypothetical protein